jgi:hypothetical protein
LLAHGWLVRESVEGTRATELLGEDQLAQGCQAKTVDRLTVFDFDL